MTDFRVESNVSIAVANSLYIRLDGTSTTTASIPFAFGVTLRDGTASQPSWNFTTEINTGMFYPATGAMGFTVLGTEVVRIGSNFLSPLADNATDLGFSGSFRWRDGWFGRNLTVNSNSTTALLVEQDGVNDNTLVVDTTNGVVGVNNAGVADQALTIGGTTNKGLVVNQTFSAASTLARATSLTHTFNGTGLAAFGSGSAPILSLATLVDERGVTSGTSDGITGLQFNLSRGSSYSFVKTSGVGIVTIGAITGTSSDSGTYQINSGNITYTKKALDFAASFSAKYDGGTGTVRTMNATIIAVDARLGTSSPALINSTNGILNTKTLMVRATGTGWAAGVYPAVTTSIGISYYNVVSGFTTIWNIFNDTASPNFMGGDNSKTYFGTGTNTLGSITGAVGDAFIQHTGTIWDFDIAIATTSIDFNRSVFDTDLNVWGDTDTMLHLDAGGALSYFEVQVADSATAFAFRDLAGNSDVVYDSTNNRFNVTGELDIDGALNHDGSTLGVFGATPAVQSTGWAMSNVTSDKVLDCNATTLDEAVDVLATLIDQLKTYGILGA